MAQNQPLIADVQHICGADGVKDQTAAQGQRFQQQVTFRVVTQGLKVAHTFHGVQDRLLIINTPVQETDFQTKPLGDQTF